MKFYLEKNPCDKLTIIKDFFLKFNIKDLDKYSDKKLYDICEFILSKDENDFLNIIKPDINLKKMVYNLLDTPSGKNKKKNSYHLIHQLINWGFVILIFKKYLGN